MLVKTSLFRPLVPVDGSWSAWSGWGQCDSECAKIRSRTCTDPPPFGGGAPCPANETLITMPTFSIDPSSVSVVYGNSSSPPSGYGASSADPNSMNVPSAGQQLPPGVDMSGMSPEQIAMINSQLNNQSMSPIVMTPSPSEMSGPPNMPQSNSTIHYNIAPCCAGDCPGKCFFDSHSYCSFKTIFP